MVLRGTQEVWYSIDNRYGKSTHWTAYGVFGPKKDELTGKWRIIHNVGLCDLYISPHIFRMIKNKNERGRVYSMHEGKERCVKGLGGKGLRERDHWRT
jgi:hypothetical protein